MIFFAMKAIRNFICLHRAVGLHPTEKRGLGNISSLINYLRILVKSRQIPRRRMYLLVSQQGTRHHNAYSRNKGTIKPAVRTRDIRKSATKRPATSQKRLVNNVYAGKDGKIYRHGLDGWQQNNKGKWQSAKPVQRVPRAKPVTRPTPSRPVTRPVRQTSPTRHRNLNRHYKSRQRGNYRTTRHRSYSRSRSYGGGRSRGGMSRGGRGGGGRGGRR